VGGGGICGVGLTFGVGGFWGTKLLNKNIYLVILSSSSIVAGYLPYTLYISHKVSNSIYHLLGLLIRFRQFRRIK
jgi:hypothetical protein